MLRSRFCFEQSAWGFAVVYLLYPSTSAAIMDTFYCRRLSAGHLRVLMADYSVVCFNDDGTPTAEWAIGAGVAGCLFLVWSVGVPASFAWRLHRNREVIRNGNPGFAGIASLRPLYMFFKPDCYMFEGDAGLPRPARTRPRCSLAHSVARTPPCRRVRQCPRPASWQG